MSAGTLQISTLSPDSPAVADVIGQRDWLVRPEYVALVKQYEGRDHAEALAECRAFVAGEIARGMVRHNVPARDAAGKPVTDAAGNVVTMVAALPADTVIMLIRHMADGQPMSASNGKPVYERSEITREIACGHKSFRGVPNPIAVRAACAYIVNTTIAYHAPSSSASTPVAASATPGNANGNRTARNAPQTARRVIRYAVADDGIGVIATPVESETTVDGTTVRQTVWTVAGSPAIGLKTVIRVDDNMPFPLVEGETLNDAIARFSPMWDACMADVASVRAERERAERAAQAERERAERDAALAAASATITTISETDTAAVVEAIAGNPAIMAAIAAMLQTQAAPPAAAK